MKLEGNTEGMENPNPTLLGILTPAKWKQETKGERGKQREREREGEIVCVSVTRFSVASG